MKTPNCCAFVRISFEKILLIAATFEMYNEITARSAQRKGHVPKNVQSNTKIGIERKTFQSERSRYAKSMRF